MAEIKVCPNCFSKKEIELIKLFPKYLFDRREIAAEMGLAISTVAFHIEHVGKKLRVIGLRAIWHEVLNNKNPKEPLHAKEVPYSVVRCPHPEYPELNEQVRRLRLWKYRAPRKSTVQTTQPSEQ